LLALRKEFKTSAETIKTLENSRQAMTSDIAKRNQVIMAYLETAIANARESVSACDAMSARFINSGKPPRPTSDQKTNHHLSLGSQMNQCLANCENDVESGANLISALGLTIADYSNQYSLILESVRKLSLKVLANQTENLYFGYNQSGSLMPALLDTSKHAGISTGQGDKAINVVALSHCGQYFYCGDEAGSIIRESAYYVSNDAGKQKAVSILEGAHNGNAVTAICCAQGDLLFTGDNAGILKKWVTPGIKKLELKSVFKTAIYKIVTTDDGKFVFVLDRTGKLRQHSARDLELVQDLKSPHKKVISDMKALPDSRNLFTFDSEGGVIQTNFTNQNQSKNYGKVFLNSVKNIAVDRNSKFLFASDHNGFLVKFNVSEMSITNYGKVFQDGLWGLTMTNDSSSIFMSNNDGWVKQFSIEKEGFLPTLGKIHDDMVNRMFVTADNKWFFTQDVNGNLKQWALEG
jgi:hypothetical protein